MKSIEASGKTVKDAIQNGLAQLGCSEDEVEKSIISMGSPGLFGMFGKPARVLLTVKGKDNSMDIEMPVFTLEQPSAKERKKAEKSVKPESEKKPVEKKSEKNNVQAAKPAKSNDGEATAPVVEQPREKRERKPRNRKDKGQPVREPILEPVTVAAPVEPAEPFVETSEDALTDTARTARAFLTELTAKMGVPASISVCESEDQLRMVLSGENMSILIGRRGETLDALQYLASLNVNRGRDEYLRVSLDTENYRAKREEALRKLAVRMANRAKKSGRRVALEPMNPNERRILHSALQNDTEVTTHSEGEEPYRRVIITLK